MRILSLLTYATTALSVLPVAANAGVMPAYSDFLLGRPFVSIFASVAGGAQNISNGQGLVIRLPISSSDFTGATVEQSTGTFIDYGGSGLLFTTGATTIDLENVRSNLLGGPIGTGDFTAELFINGTDNGRSGIFHYQFGGTDLVTLSTQQQIFIDSGFKALLANYGVTTSANGLVGAVTVHVSEPAALALFGIGAGLLSLARRRAE